MTLPTGPPLDGQGRRRGLDGDGHGRPRCRGAGVRRVSSGAANDLQQATDIARRMVTEWGMSETVGPMSLADQGPVFLGEDMMQSKSYSRRDAEAGRRRDPPHPLRSRRRLPRAVGRVPPRPRPRRSGAARARDDQRVGGRAPHRDQPAARHGHPATPSPPRIRRRRGRGRRQRRRLIDGSGSPGRSERSRSQGCSPAVLGRRTAAPASNTHRVPSVLDRRDFARPDAPWLVAVFTSSTCATPAPACGSGPNCSAARRSCVSGSTSRIDKVAPRAVPDRRGTDPCRGRCRRCGEAGVPGPGHRHRSVGCGR